MIPDHLRAKTLPRLNGKALLIFGSSKDSTQINLRSTGERRSALKKYSRSGRGRSVQGLKEHGAERFRTGGIPSDCRGAVHHFSTDLKCSSRVTESSVLTTTRPTRWLANAASILRTTNDLPHSLQVFAWNSFRTTPSRNKR